ncbi:hypothetical protein, partial [Bacteroides cellulosilyticus]|uniref:hypothetical protein n=1 Tax=Bacteroides cellulosilyticus TaxID=246787 RepID=UPI0032C13CF7
IYGLFFRRVPAGTRLKGDTLKLETYRCNVKDGIFCCERCHLLMLEMPPFATKDAIFCITG